MAEMRLRSARQEAEQQRASDRWLESEHPQTTQTRAKAISQSRLSGIEVPLIDWLTLRQLASTLYRPAVASSSRGSSTLHADLCCRDQYRANCHRVPDPASLCRNFRAVERSCDPVIAEAASSQALHVGNHALLVLVADQAVACPTPSERNGSVDLSAGAKLRESIGCALCDQRSLKLRKDCRHLRHSPALRRAKVDSVGHRHKPERALCKPS